MPSRLPWAVVSQERCSRCRREPSDARARSYSEMACVHKTDLINWRGQLRRAWRTIGYRGRPWAGGGEAY